MTDASPTRTLARVVRIASIEPIVDADAIELATVLGFQCVVAKKDNLKVNDLVLYFGLGALLEPNENTEFLGGKRIGIRKMRGVVSEGLVAPLSWVTKYGLDPTQLVEDQDLTAQMHVRIYIPSEEIGSHTTEFSANLLGKAIPKTDESRLQENVRKLYQLDDRKSVITLKMDGCSATYAVVGGKLSLYSRNVDVTPLATHKTFAHYHQYLKGSGLDERLLKYCTDEHRDLALQGELCAHNINGGRTGTPRLEYYLFNVWNVAAQQYLNWTEVEEIAQKLSIKTVPVLHKGVELPSGLKPIGDRKLNSGAREACQGWVRWTDQLEYMQGKPAEGIVCKSDDDQGPRVSFKVIAPRYLLLLEKKRG